LRKGTLQKLKNLPAANRFASNYRIFLPKNLFRYFLEPVRNAGYRLAMQIKAANFEKNPFKEFPKVSDKSKIANGQFYNLRE
jgi:hypothetical protein